MKKILLLLLCVPLIGLGQQTNVSAQTTDTIKFLDKVITMKDVNTNREYYQAMLSLIEDEEAKKDTTESEALKDVKALYRGLINDVEAFLLDDLSPQAEKIENRLQQYLINNPKKVQFHVNKGKKFSKGETDPLDFEYDLDISQPFPGEPGYKPDKKLD